MTLGRTRSITSHRSRSTSMSRRWYPDPDDRRTRTDGARRIPGDLPVSDRSGRACDAADEYWVICHQIVDDWRDIDRLVRDEQAVAACWAFEHDYIGVQIAGTIHNEVRIAGPLTFPAAGSAREAPAEGGGPSTNLSGGGRSPAATPTGVGASSTPRPDGPDRAAHRRRAASYSHPSDPPRDHLGGFAASRPRRST